MCEVNSFGPVMKRVGELERHMEGYWFESKKSSGRSACGRSKSLLLIVNERVGLLAERIFTFRWLIKMSLWVEKLLSENNIWYRHDMFNFPRSSNWRPNRVRKTTTCQKDLMPPKPSISGWWLWVQPRHPSLPKAHGGLVRQRSKPL